MEDIEIKVSGLKKDFGRRKVLKGIDFSLKKGGFLSVFGPNGAGKTTMVKILSTLEAPTKGDVTIAGIDLMADPIPIKKKIGLISHNPLLYGDLNAHENLRFYGVLYKVDDLESRIDELLDRVELSNRRYDYVRTFSQGMTQRLAIARALIHKPSILFLDEPHIGLDPHAVDILDGLLDDIRAEHTFVMVTHNLEKGLTLCSQAMILDGGKIVFFEEKNDIKRNKFEAIYKKSVKGEVV